MFEQASIDLVHYLESSTDFTSVMEHDGQINLFPIIALEDTVLPLATYMVGEVSPMTKEVQNLSITLMLWFSTEKYLECCQLTDKMIDYISERYQFTASSIEFNEESFTYSGVINFNLI